MPTSNTSPVKQEANKGGENKKADKLPEHKTGQKADASDEDWELLEPWVENVPLPLTEGGRLVDPKKKK